MSRNQLPASLPITVGDSFYKRIVHDISGADWARLARLEPTFKDLIFEGFSTRIDKLARLVRQPRVETRLCRLLRTDALFFELVMDLWAEAQLLLLSFVEMLDPGFLLEHWIELKDLIGPERFLACLILTDRLEDPNVLEKFDERFWDRDLELGTLDLLLPTAAVWRELAADYPKVVESFEQCLWSAAKVAPPPPPAPAEDRPDRRQLRREQERRARVEARLEQSEGEKRKVEEDLKQVRAEAEALRGRLAQVEQEQQRRLEDELARERARWFQRYRAVDTAEQESYRSAIKGLDDLLNKADRALQLQAAADEQYGLVEEVARRLLRIEFYLQEMERIQAESLVVHVEVNRVRQAMEAEKERILRLPGSERLTSGREPLPTADPWRRRLRFLEQSPLSLAKLAKLKALLEQMEGLELLPDIQVLTEAVAQKERQIQERIYQQFQPAQPAAARGRPLSLDELVAGGQSRRYDLYVDGYNILLQLDLGQSAKDPRALAELRESLIARMVAKGRLFRKVFLVFDGIDGSRDRQGNVDIIYSDKHHGINADAIIIDALKKRRDQNSLLVTADREIIEATQQRVFGIIAPLHFYSLLFDLAPPEPGSPRPSAAFFNPGKV